ncbi:Lrp/AsnC family transcriptional regulator [Candidatus Enterococcus huntleyi]|uniref:Lrp/AsnC family transcriptional regulator n=1 Tax=Candidatus Enterococcus huntleyi TaxID=1857217 RepID=UPI00137AED3D|nr:AsnC family transcriptional regulator [Enterococcus sp. JM4C]
MDEIDKEILAILTENSRLSNKEIGQLIHMTGQAVGNRITKMIENGTIKKFTIEINRQRTQFIRIYMDSNRFEAFEKMVNAHEEITSFCKISGQACYMVTAHFTDEALGEFIDELADWARYTIETVLSDRLD